MFRNQCGSQLTDQARFCPVCGALRGAQFGPAVSGQQTLPPGAMAMPSGMPPTLVVPQTESMAIVSLVLGILSLTVFHFLAGIPAIIVGRSARNKIRAYPQQLTGEGMATAGIVMGWISVGIICCVVLLFVVVMIVIGVNAR